MQTQVNNVDMEINEIIVSLCNYIHTYVIFNKKSSELQTFNAFVNKYNELSCCSALINDEL